MNRCWLGHDYEKWNTEAMINIYDQDYLDQLKNKELMVGQALVQSRICSECNFKDISTTYIKFPSYTYAKEPEKNS